MRRVYEVDIIYRRPTGELRTERMIVETQTKAAAKRAAAWAFRLAHPDGRIVETRRARFVPEDER